MLPYRPGASLWSQNFLRDRVLAQAALITSQEESKACFFPKVSCLFLQLSHLFGAQLLPQRLSCTQHIHGRNLPPLHAAAEKRGISRTVKLALLRLPKEMQKLRLFWEAEHPGANTLQVLRSHKTHLQLAAWERLQSHKQCGLLLFQAR